MDSKGRERVERRLAAIMAADVVGYARLMEEDEEGTLERLKEHVREVFAPKIAEHHGRIVKTTGDGLLAEFGSVVDAVRCAVELQHDIAARNAGLPDARRIEIRIGINLGDIIVERKDIFGDGVNVAARLETLAEPGGICVSSVVREQVRDKLDIAFRDMGDQHVKNIARPVHAFHVLLDGSKAGDGDLAAFALSTATLALPDKPSIAVLPFTNMSSDPEQDFFADGISEDIITALSRYPSLFVIARNSCFTYKGRSVDVKQVGRELGVRYVLEGSLRKAGNRVRVTAQLVEADTGNHVWAERYDRDLADIFAVQDEITEAATTAIAPAIADVELQRAMRKPPENLDAWGAYQRGIWHLSKFTADDTTTAETYFSRATVLDPTFAGGHKGLAAAQIQASITFTTRRMDEALASAETLARQAVALDLADAEALTTLGRVLLLRADYEGSRSEIEHALTISPNLASAHGILGSTLIFSGYPKEGLVSLERGIRLDPRDPRMAISVNQLVIGRYYSRDYDAAVEAARRVIRSYPDHPLVYRWLAAALGQLGRIAEAKEALAKAIAIAPAAFDLYVRRRVPWHRPEDYEHLVAGLRKAGWQPN
jgi:adenylate cyclase